MPTKVTRNGKQYDSGDVRVTYFGFEEDEIKSITYNNEQEHQLNKSLSNNATSYSMGAITPTCTIEMYMTAVRRLEKMAKSATGSADLLKVKPFQVAVSFLNEDQDEVHDTIVLKFKSQGRTVTGEMGLAQQFEMFTLETKFDV